jgi:Flp pilus assembly protein CpaB
MDDEAQIGGWIPTEQTRPGRDNTWSGTELPVNAQAAPVRESLFTPRVSPTEPPGFSHWGSGMSERFGSASASAAGMNRTAGPDWNAGLSQAAGPNRDAGLSQAAGPNRDAGPGHTAGPNPTRPGRPARSDPTVRSNRVPGRRPVGRAAVPWRHQLSTARQRARPSNWRRPARLGSGPVRTTRLLLARHRRPLAACLALAGLWVTVRSAAPPPPPTLTILVAAHDLPAGRTLSSDDLRTRSWPAANVPLGRLTAGAGRVLAAPIRSGEPLTDARVVGPGLLAGQALGTVAVPVRLGEAAAGAMVRAGDRVDVLASASTSTVSSAWTDPPGDTAPDADTRAEAGPSPGASRDDGSGVERVAASALVLAVPGAGSAGDPGLSGSTGSGFSGLTGGSTSAADAAGASTSGVLMLAVSSDEARRLAAAQAGRQLGIAVLPRP